MSECDNPSSLHIPSDPAISIEQIKIEICNINRPINCQMVKRNSSVHIWGSTTVTGLTIDSLRGKISTSTPFKHNNIHGYVDIFNDAVNSQHHAVIVSEQGELWIKFSNKPIIPIKVPINGSFHFNLLLTI
jgi:hypothetical protein